MELPTGEFESWDSPDTTKQVVQRVLRAARYSQYHANSREYCGRIVLAFKHRFDRYEDIEHQAISKHLLWIDAQDFEKTS